MRSSDDDLREDPQQTLPPRRHEAARRIVASEPGPNPSAEKPKGRRLRLGTPTRSAPSQASPEQSEMEPTLNRGFNLGGETARVNALGAAGAKPGVQRWVWFVAAGAIVLLAVALLLRPSSETSAQAIANDRLLRQYTQYLETKGRQNNVDVNERKKEVIRRLQAVEWAKAIGDRAALENELKGLLFMDNDKNSPLYQYSVTQLKQLGPRKESGL